MTAPASEERSSLVMIKSLSISCDCWKNTSPEFLTQLNEDEIVSIFKSTLKSLSSLHFIREIHQEIKAGNIVSDREGHAKLAGCGLAGHLTVSCDSTGSSILQRSI